MNRTKPLYMVPYDLKYITYFSIYNTYIGLYLATHVAAKGFEVGAISGMMIVYPILRFVRKIPSRNAWITSMAVTPIIGCIGSSLMLVNKHIKGDLTVEGVDDRAYRISQGKQPQIDKTVALGLSMGFFYGLGVSGVGVLGTIACATSTIPGSMVIYQLVNAYKQRK